MQVTNVRVSFLREKQPAQYEKSAPAVEYSAVLSDGENHEVAARKLMISATKVVYNGLGFEVPAKVAAALADGEVPAELSVATDASAAPEDAPLAAEKPVEDGPKARGRPKGSKNTGPKKETAAAKRKREAAEADGAAERTAGAEAAETSQILADRAAAAETDGIPGDDEPAAISTGEPRVGPEDAPEDHGIPGDDDGVPGEDETTAEEAEGETEFTPKDLHALIMSHVNATPRTLSVANAKQVLAHFKVARAQDLTAEQAVEGRELVEKMIAAAPKGS